MRTYIKDINNKIDEKITVNGFVHAVRDQGGIIFLIIRDVTGLCQVVINKKNKKVFELASELSLEKGNQLMLRRIHESSLQKGEYQKFLEDGFNICELNAFLKATYIKEEERYNKWFAKKREY